jgi:UDP-N-acetylglucosamine--N-acetylmuramyl-(pentapeptide) pyrophosphoryl-undecaprenol N-acetylglucosamine transferase
MKRLETPRSDLARKKIVLAGGGSGGHITPLITVGQLLKKRGVELWLMGDLGGQRFRVLTDQLGVPVVDIPAGKIRRYWSVANLSTPGRVVRGLVTAYRHLKRLRPDLVFAKGGFASFPIIISAYLLRIPIVLHESDAVMGLANQRSARYATKICVNFPIAAYPSHLQVQAKLTWTGMPISEKFFHLPPPQRTGHFTILVTGGSQGAEALNKTISRLARARRDYQIIHITGPEHYGRYLGLASPNYQVYGLVSSDMFSQLLGEADLVIARASATTYAEIAAAGRPAILIPLPEPAAANNHQLSNAKAWQRAGAVRVLEQKDLGPQVLEDWIQRVQQKTTWEEMRRSAQTIGQPGAAERVVEVIREVLA